MPCADEYGGGGACGSCCSGGALCCGFCGGACRGSCAAWYCGGGPAGSGGAEKAAPLVMGTGAGYGRAAREARCQPVMMVQRRGGGARWVLRNGASRPCCTQAQMLQTWLGVVRIGGRLLRLLRRRLLLLRISLMVCLVQIVRNLLVVPLLRESTASECSSWLIWRGVERPSTEDASDSCSAGPYACGSYPSHGVSAGSMPYTPATHLCHLLRHLTHLLQHLRVHPPVRVLVLRTVREQVSRRAHACTGEEPSRPAPRAPHIHAERHEASRTAPPRPRKPLLPDHARRLAMFRHEQVVFVFFPQKKGPTQKDHPGSTQMVT